MAGLRIGVNALYLLPGNVGGTEIYLRGLLRAWQCLDTPHRFVLFTNRETGGDLVGPHPRFETRVQPLRAMSRPARLLWEQTIFPIEAERAGIDVLFNPGFTAPLLARCPMVTVFHDLQHKRHPEYFRWFDLPFWRLFLSQAALTSTRLIAVSQATRDDLLRWYPVSPEIVDVIAEGAEDDLALVRARRSEQPFFLCPSTSHPHKNLPRLVRAFAAFAREAPEFKLVMTGVRGFAHDELLAAVGASGVTDRIELKGWLARPELHELFAQACALVYPTQFEGFGLPVLEGMSAGVPVICSRIPVLEEVAGEDAMYFDPLSDEELTAALRRIAIDAELRARLSRNALQRSASFTWERAARETLRSLELARGAG